MSAQMLLRPAEKSFLARFFAVFFVLFALIVFADLRAFDSIIASIQAFLLRASGIPVIQNGVNLTFSGLNASVVNECSGLVMVALLAALLYASDMPERTRRTTLAVFTPFLLLFNIGRLFVTLEIFFTSQSLFDAVHVFLWFVDSAVVLSIWYFALRSSTLPKPGPIPRPRRNLKRRKPSSGRKAI